MYLSKEAAKLIHFTVMLCLVIIYIYVLLFSFNQHLLISFCFNLEWMCLRFFQLQKQETNIYSTAWLTKTFWRRPINKRLFYTNTGDKDLFSNKQLPALCERKLSSFKGKLSNTISITSQIQSSKTPSHRHRLDF